MGMIEELITPSPLVSDLFAGKLHPAFRDRIPLRPCPASDVIKPLDKLERHMGTRALDLRTVERAALPEAVRSVSHLCRMVYEAYQGPVDDVLCSPPFGGKAKRKCRNGGKGCKNGSGSGNGNGNGNGKLDMGGGEVALRVLYPFAGHELHWAIVRDPADAGEDAATILAASRILHPSIADDGLFDTLDTFAARGGTAHAVLDDGTVTIHLYGPPVKNAHAKARVVAALHVVLESGALALATRCPKLPTGNWDRFFVACYADTDAEGAILFSPSFGTDEHGRMGRMGQDDKGHVEMSVGFAYDKMLALDKKKKGNGRRR